MKNALFNLLSHCYTWGHWLCEWNVKYHFALLLATSVKIMVVCPDSGLVLMFYSGSATTFSL